MESSNNKRATTTTIIILLATALLISGAVFFSQQNDPKDTANKTKITKTEDTKKQTTQNIPTNNMATKYKEGSYSATGQYQSPGGGQEIKIRITLGNDGTITDTSAEGDDKSSDSRFYQSSFISKYKDKVVGKNIDEVKLDRVGASSLTPIGFNNALEDIKQEAKA